jgi:predicted Ser/Thr protein kinase
MGGMADTTPSQIGPYRLTREIGRGGMGIVYLARDTKLDRDVAIKCLPDGLAGDPDRLARFEREAKTLASLNHPNVATVHGFEEVEDRRYIVLEYIDGETLEDRLNSGALPIDEALDVAVQVAQAVEAAHDKGIIHRDLKPANIKLTSDDQVKVLDFGLAKALDDRASSVVDIGESPTMVEGGSPTMPGVILGTAGYLSPEQARGKPVDQRTDVFSYGCVLYEMLAGRPPFPGETIADSISATLQKDVPVDELPPTVPFMVRHVLRRCLERDRKRRLRDIGDARIELEGALDAPGPVDADVDERASSRGRPGPVAVAVTALVMVVIGAALGRQLASPVAAPVVHLAIPPPPNHQIRHTGDLSGPPVVSPDGRSVAFVASAPGEAQRLWVRRIDEPEAREIPETDGAMFPFWSFDGRSVGFFTRQKLRRVDLETYTVMSIADVQEGRGGAWTADGRIIYAPRFASPLCGSPLR